LEASGDRGKDAEGFFDYGVEVGEALSCITVD
jgi:hypothetical protein